MMIDSTQSFILWEEDNTEKNLTYLEITNHYYLAAALVYFFAIEHAR